MNSKGRNSKPFGKISSLKRAQNSSFRKCKKKRFKRGKDKKATTSWKGRVRKCEGRDRKNLAKKQIQGQRGQRGQKGQKGKVKKLVKDGCTTVVQKFPPKSA